MTASFSFCVRQRALRGVKRAYKMPAVPVAALVPDKRNR